MTSSAAFWAALLLLGWSAAAPAQANPCGGERHAVVIGINDYRNGVPRLRGAVRDAKRVAAALTARGYSVRTLLNKQATRDALREVLGDYLLKHTKPDDEVLVYFSGHGETLGSDDRPMGYLMPADADANRVGVTGLAMSEVVGWMSTWPAQRRLLVADACYSGLAVPSTRRVRADEAAGSGQCRPSNQVPVTAVLVAGRKGDEANETSAGGAFTRVFLRALDGAEAADPNGDGWISHKTLGGYLSEVVRDEVKSAWGREQIPQSGQLGEGAFYLRGKPGPGAQAVARTARRAAAPSTRRTTPAAARGSATAQPSQPWYLDGPGAKVLGLPPAAPVPSSKLPKYRSKAQVMGVLKAHAARIRQCRRQAPKQKGEVKVSFTILHTGRVRGATLRGIPPESPQGACVKAEVLKMRFSKKRGAAQEVKNYPFKL